MKLQVALTYTSRYAARQGENVHFTSVQQFELGSYVVRGYKVGMSKFRRAYVAFHHGGADWTIIEEPVGHNLTDMQLLTYARRQLEGNQA